MKRIQRFFASMRTAYDHEKALRGMYRLGKQAGRNEQPPVVYQQACAQHGTRLENIAPGIFICPTCRMFANFAQVQADVERVTGPMQRMEETDSLVHLVKQAQTQPGVLRDAWRGAGSGNTERMRAILRKREQ